MRTCNNLLQKRAWGSGRLILSDGLKPSNNNANALRLIAACAVIFGHAYSLVPNAGKREPIGKLLGFDYSGSLAVKFFFVLSGLLIANSWMRNSSIVHFVFARFFRIMPALVASKIFCLFVLGPALTTLTLSAYFDNTWMYQHVWRYPLMGYAMPGVFEKNPIPNAANGSIWTIQYEVAMYAVLLGAALCGLLRNRLFASAILIAVIILSAGSSIITDAIGLAGSNGANLLPGFFAFGMLLAVNQRDITIDGRLVLGGIILCVVSYHGAAFQYAFWFAFIISTLWLMTTPAIGHLFLPGDFSYGVYVFGWPIQQTIVQLFPGLTVGEHILSSVFIALLFGATSWYLIEKPSMRLGSMLSAACMRFSGTQSASRPRGAEAPATGV